MTWSLLPKICKQNTRQYHNWRGKSNSTFLHELPHTMFFLDDQKTGMFRKGAEATGWLKSGFGQTPGLDRGRHFGKRWPKQTLFKKILTTKKAHANLYEDPFPSYLTASSLPPLESPPPPADVLSLSKYQVAFFSSENRNISWSSIDILERSTPVWTIP